MDRRTSFLVKLARQSAATWHALCAQAFSGESKIETENTLYRLEDGVFAGRAKKPGAAFETPAAMKGARLLGFLVDEGGLFSISPRWRRGALAVFWKPGSDKAEIDPKSIVLTSATLSFERKEPEPQPWVRPNTGSHSNIRRRGRPPTLRRPQPPSMTRVLKNPPR
jgi:hypothetical protein